MSELSHAIQLRVRYGETDQMGTFYNARALDWFECGRSELMRHRMGMSYAQMEERGFFLPLVEAHMEFKGGARYDDLLEVTSVAAMMGRARLKFEVQIRLVATGKTVVTGSTVHAFTDARGRAVRPPEWFLTLMDRSAAAPGTSAQP